MKGRLLKTRQDTCSGNVKSPSADLNFLKQGLKAPANCPKRPILTHAIVLMIEFTRMLLGQLCLGAQKLLVHADLTAINACLDVNEQVFCDLPLMLVK